MKVEYDVTMPSKVPSQRGRWVNLLWDFMEGSHKTIQITCATVNEARSTYSSIRQCIVRSGWRCELTRHGKIITIAKGDS